MIQQKGTGSGRSGLGVKVTFSVVFILSTLAVVSMLLISFVNKVFDSNREELYNYLMHTGIVACAISVIKFNLLSVGGLKLQITDIEEPFVKKTIRRATCFDQVSDSSDDDDDAPYPGSPSASPQKARPSTSRVPPEARPSTSRTPQEARPSTSWAPQEAGPSTSRAPQEAKPSTSRAPQEGKPSTSRAFQPPSESRDDEDDVVQQNLPSGSGDERRSPIKTRSKVQRDIELATPQYSKGRGKGRGLNRKM